MSFMKKTLILLLLLICWFQTSPFAYGQGEWQVNELLSQAENEGTVMRGAVGVPNRPFPQRLTYASGTIRPTNFTQAQQDQHVRDFYDYWKTNYLVDAGTNGTGQQMYRVAFGVGSDVTVSEGQGYGMVIVALMAGHDADAQVLFDGLWYFAREYPSGIDNRLMSWKIENGTIVGRNNSAFDGDVDIAYGLLLADAQWGSDSNVDYAAEGSEVIDGILASTIGESSRLPMLGDWVNDNGSPHNQYTPRSSDFMPAHFRAFGRAKNDAVWETVISNSQAAIDSIQSSYSPVTGLLPDFMINCSSANNCEPAYADFLEGSHDGHYYYNAGRDPWRIGLDALLNDDATSRAEVQKMVSWVASSSGGDASQIKAGFQLDGTVIGNYLTTFFVAPFGVGAMLDESQQAFLNDIYATVYNKHENYYEDSVNLLALLAMTGNYWDPTDAPSPDGTLNGSVAFQGRPSPPHPRWAMPLDVSLTIPGESTPAYEFSPTTDQSGNFSLTGIAPGTYEVRIKHVHTLQVMQTVTLADGNNSIAFGILPEGDANDNNQVTLIDFSILATTFDKCEGVADFDERADFNEDNCILLADFSLLATNFGQVGQGTQAAHAVAPTLEGRLGESAMSISPAQTSILPGDTFSVTVQLEAPEQQVDGAQVLLNFDPAILKVEKVMTGDQFALELANQFDDEHGTILFAAGTLQEFPSGEIDFIDIQFKALKAGETELQFEQNGTMGTDVTFGGASVLGELADGMVTVNQPTAVTLRQLGKRAVPLPVGALVALMLLAGGLLLVQRRTEL